VYGEERKETVVLVDSADNLWDEGVFRAFPERRELAIKGLEWLNKWLRSNRISLGFASHHLESEEKDGFWYFFKQGMIDKRPGSLILDLHPKAKAAGLGEPE